MQKIYNRILQIAGDVVTVEAKDVAYRDLAEIMSGENVFGPPQMPLWMLYLDEIRRAEEYALYGGRDPQKALDEVQVRVEREMKRLLKQKKLK